MVHPSLWGSSQAGAVTAGDCGAIFESEDNALFRAERRAAAFLSLSCGQGGTMKAFGSAALLGLLAMGIGCPGLTAYASEGPRANAVLLNGPAERILLSLLGCQ
jgi:hypothetical protein